MVNLSPVMPLQYRTERKLIREYQTLKREESSVKIQTFLLIVMLTLVLPVLANAQSGADESTIRHVVQYYFDGWKNNDVESMKKAFHPKAKWFFQSDKYDLREVPISQVYANTRETARQ